MSPADETVGRVLRFWFGPDGGRAGTERPEWFTADPAFDAACRDALGAETERALAGDLDDLVATPSGTLALVVLLDQLPRNIHRGTAAAFAGDAAAKRVAERLIDRGFDRVLTRVQRLFLYLPFEHSEDIEDQERAVALFEALGHDGWLDYARRHRDVIAQFGRFPHRNEALGRDSTEAEREFLADTGSGF
ncbi:MAG: DUF924 domain-containing protein [Rhodospirillales bacterium]|nr:MAG: DUF924 domain-containing protein [Rhodospirillales bacterium]